MVAEKEDTETSRISWHLKMTGEDQVFYQDTTGRVVGEIRGQLLKNLRIGASQEGITLDEAVKIYLDAWHYGL